MYSLLHSDKLTMANLKSELKKNTYVIKGISVVSSCYLFIPMLAFSGDDSAQLLREAFVCCVFLHSASMNRTGLYVRDPFPVFSRHRCLHRSRNTRQVGALFLQTKQNKANTLAPRSIKWSSSHNVGTSACQCALVYELRVREKR